MSRQAICPDCGWAGKPTISNAMAEHAFRKHTRGEARRGPRGPSGQRATVQSRAVAS